MAVLAAVSFPTATRREFGSDSELYSLGATVAYAVGVTQSIELYANVDVLDGEATDAVAELSFSIGDSIGGYVEAGFQPALTGRLRATRRRGLTWLVRPHVQLDVYFRRDRLKQARTYRLASACPSSFRSRFAASRDSTACAGGSVAANPVSSRESSGSLW
jgi:hypothetical protein